MMLLLAQVKAVKYDSPEIAVGVLCCVVPLYFLPVLIAALRAHPSGAAIFVVNLFLGWSLIGWVIALAWSLAAIERRRPRPRYYDDE
jgi:hypothetical protein